MIDIFPPQIFFDLLNQILLCFDRAQLFFDYLDQSLVDFAFCFRLYILQALNARKLCHASVAEMMPKSHRDKYDDKSHC